MSGDFEGSDELGTAQMGWCDKPADIACFRNVAHEVASPGSTGLGGLEKGDHRHFLMEDGFDIAEYSVDASGVGRVQFSRTERATRCIRRTEAGAKATGQPLFR